MRCTAIAALPVIIAISISGCVQAPVTAASTVTAAPSTANTNIGPLPTTPPLGGQIPLIGVINGILPPIGKVTDPTTPAPAPPCEALTLTAALFDTNLPTLRRDSASALDYVANRLKSHTGSTTIIGYSDPRPTSYPGGNQKLSEDRARAVRDALTRRSVTNIDQVHGRGATDLVDSGTTEAAYQRNRRVEITVHCTNPNSINQPTPRP